MDCDSDRDSDTYSVASISGNSLRTTASSATTQDFDIPIRSVSPSSVISITSSMQLYKRAYGRELNNYSEIYGLPADEDEMDRLNLQHQIFIEILGERYPPGMTEVLEEDENSAEKKTCLDLGCGTGIWITEVCRDFPHVDAVALDLIPMRATEMPQNLRSEVDDINSGLEHYFGDFNVVHARLIAAGIRDYHRMIDQLASVTRPGGLVDLSEFDFSIYDANHQRVLFNGDDDIRAPWWGRWMCFFRDAVKAKGGDVDAATNLHAWVCRNPLFEDVTYKEYWLPIVSEPRVDQAENIRRHMESNVTTFLGAGRPLLLESGVSEALVILLEEKAMSEIEERNAPQFTRLQCVTARRKT